MKSYILTYHFAKNYGAVLQCWALQKALISVGSDTRVLDYQDTIQEKNNSLYKQNSGVKRIIKNILYTPYHREREEKYAKFEEFVLNQLVRTPHITTVKELMSFLVSESKGVIFVGSDQVWNPKIEDFTEAFFLPFETNHIKATYAASVGPTTVNEIRNYKRWIEEFQHISIREKTTADALSQIVDNHITLVPDPVFLVSKQDWNEMSIQAADNIVSNEKYMLCYYLNKKHMLEYCRISDAIAKQKHLKVYNIIGGLCPLYYKKNTIRNAGPVDFISLIKQAEIVCTDSFHGTVFSIIFGKEFYSFDIKSENSDNRKKSILERVGLIDRYVTLDNPEISNNKIEYDIVKKKIEVIKEEGMSYLRSSLGSC